MRGRETGGREERGEIKNEKERRHMERERRGKKERERRGERGGERVRQFRE